MSDRSPNPVRTDTVIEVEEAAPKAPSGLAGLWAGFRDRIRQGELGALPVILGLALIWTFFDIKNPRFLWASNLTNLFLQISAVGLISVGIVLVLLLGEIDLSVGSVSGLCAALMAVANVKHGVPAPLAIGFGLIGGLAIGLLQGFWSTRFRIPSFVVTLAGLLGWYGVQLQVLGETGGLNITDRGITGLALTFLDPAVGWVVAIGAVVVYVAAKVLAIRRRAAAGLPAGSLRAQAGRLVVVSAAILAAVAIMNRDRGLPVAILILVGFTVVLDLVTRRTRFGRHIYAVGGNAEAARRSGINVTRVRIAVFAICSFMAAAGGILASARLLLVNQQSGGGDVLLTAIASAVIGGTSLFGGRGFVWSAVLGALVIGSIRNGMDLLSYPSPVKFMVIGAVLLASVTIDSVARRGREAAGRA